jgi:hypothetical protein
MGVARVAAHSHLLETRAMSLIYQLGRHMLNTKAPVRTCPIAMVINAAENFSGEKEQYNNGKRRPC